MRVSDMDGEGEGKNFFPPKLQKTVSFWGPMSHTPAVAQAPAVADAAVASPAAESSYFDPDFEFDCPKYQDFAAITARAEAAAARLQAILAATDVTGRQTPSPLSAGPLDQSHTDDWFFGDNARKLEYIGDGVV